MFSQITLKRPLIGYTNITRTHKSAYIVVTL
jgi:hypothetical protein